MFNDIKSVARYSNSHYSRTPSYVGNDDPNSVSDSSSMLEEKLVKPTKILHRYHRSNQRTIENNRKINLLAAKKYQQPQLVAQQQPKLKYVPIILKDKRHILSTKYLKHNGKSSGAKLGHREKTTFSPKKITLIPEQISEQQFQRNLLLRAYTEYFIEPYAIKINKQNGRAKKIINLFSLEKWVEEIPSLKKGFNLYHACFDRDHALFEKFVKENQSGISNLLLKYRDKALRNTQVSKTELKDFIYNTPHVINEFLKLHDVSPHSSVVAKLEELQFDQFVKENKNAIKQHLFSRRKGGNSSGRVSDQELHSFAYETPHVYKKFIDLKKARAAQQAASPAQAALTLYRTVLNVLNLEKKQGQVSSADIEQLRSFVNRTPTTEQMKVQITKLLQQADGHSEYALKAQEKRVRYAHLCTKVACLSNDRAAVNCRWRYEKARLQAMYESNNAAQRLHRQSPAQPPRKRAIVD